MVGKYLLPVGAKVWMIGDSPLAARRCATLTEVIEIVEGVPNHR